MASPTEEIQKAAPSITGSGKKQHRGGKVKDASISWTI
jgi:hypothetical protein